jgi:hypothetical protein
MNSQSSREGNQAMNRHSILGWGGAVAASVLMLAACGSSATSGSSSSASAGGQASAQTTSSGASASTSAAASHAPIAAAIDPCTLITQDEAKAAMGGDPGPGKPAAGTPACTYGTPGQTAGYMLVADADVSHVPGFDNFNKDTARTKIQETIAKNGGTLTETSGIGDWGFMVLGASGKAAASYIFFVKGSIYVSIVLIPSSTTPATGDVMTGLAKLAVDRV